MIKNIILFIIGALPICCYLNMFLNKMRDNEIKYGEIKWADVINGAGLICLMILVGLFYCLVFK